MVNFGGFLFEQAQIDNDNIFKVFVMYFYVKGYILGALYRLFSFNLHCNFRTVKYYYYLDFSPVRKQKVQRS